jgi:hypothetical protein
VWPPAWLVPPGDAHALAAALGVLLTAGRAGLEAGVRSRWREIEPEFGGGAAERILAVLRVAAGRGV